MLSRSPAYPRGYKAPWPCLPRPSFGPWLNLVLLYLVPNSGGGEPSPPLC